MTNNKKLRNFVKISKQ